MTTFAKLHLVKEWLHNWLWTTSTYADPKAIQQINFTGNLSGNDNRLIFFTIEEAEETIFNFSQRTVKVIQFYFVLM